MKKKDYIAPMMGQIKVNVEQYLCDLSFSDEPADPGDALSKGSNVWDDDEEEEDENVSTL